MREKQHEVELTRGFWFAETELTQAQWEVLMDDNPSEFKGDNKPVGKVNWDKAVEYCMRLTNHRREADKLPAGMYFTLPTEAQWEYACRAGTKSALNNGKELTSVKGLCENLNEVAWYSDKTSHDKTSQITEIQEVGLKKANHWGLFCMHGNVREWCLDWFTVEPAGGKDPTGLAMGGPLENGNMAARVNRGGCWDVAPMGCRSAYRGGNQPKHRWQNIGFRVVLLGADVKPSEEPSALLIERLEDKHKPGDRVIVPIADGVEMAFRWCPSGDFIMGSPETEVGRNGIYGNYVDLEKQRKVKISRGYWIGETEVTQAQWMALMERNKSHFKGMQRPVEMVNVLEAMEFCQKLTEQARKSGDIPADRKFSLPTASQWEYACRAGTKSALNSGKELTSPMGKCPNMDAIAWYLNNSGNTTHDVAQKLANQWGLHDMHGNVFEWCLDLMVGEPSGESAPSGSTLLSLYGGALGSEPCVCRSAFHKSGIQSESNSPRWKAVGFRVALVPDKPKKPESTNQSAKISPDVLSGKHKPGDRLLVPIDGTNTWTNASPRYVAVLPSCRTQRSLAACNPPIFPMTAPPNTLPEKQIPSNKTYCHAGSPMLLVILKLLRRLSEASPGFKTPTFEIEL